MPKRILRSFLYMDEAIVDDYLAQYEGSILDGSYTSKDTTTGGKQGSADIKAGIFGGSAGGNTSSTSEILQTLREPAAARFTRLYDHMKEDDAIQPLNGFDETVYEQIETGEIVEVRGIAKLPQWEHLSNAISGMSGLVEVMKAVGMDPLADPAANEAFQGFSTLTAKKVSEFLELIISPIGSPNFKFVANLDKTKISRRQEELEAEITILGKVRRKLAKGETIDIFRIAPRMNELQNLNRSQRRAAAKNKAKMPSTDSPLDEIIKYPAMQIQAIAIYQ